MASKTDVSWDPPDLPRLQRLLGRLRTGPGRLFCLSSLRTNGDRVWRSLEQFDLKNWKKIGLKLSLLQPSEWA